MEWDFLKKFNGLIKIYFVFILDSVYLVFVKENVIEVVIGRLELYINYIVKVRV